MAQEVELPVSGWPGQPVLGAEMGLGPLAYGAAAGPAWQ